MAIKGLTGTKVAFPEIGKLFKGAPKQVKERDGRTYEVFGRELDHWRFESPSPAIKEAFYQTFGEKPKELFVYLPFPKAEDNLKTCKEAYTAGALQHRCDGETCSLWLDPKTNQYRTDPIECPTLKMTPEQAKKSGCQNVARLQVIIPALNEIGFVTVETHSKNDIGFLDSILPAYEGLQPSGLTKIPFSLYRYPKEISTPQNGKRTRVIKWLVGIKPMGEWASRYLSAKSQFLLTETIEMKMLAPAEIEPGEEEDGDTGEALASPEVAVEIEKLWPVAGYTSESGNIIPLADYLLKMKQVTSPSILSAESANVLLGRLRARAAEKAAQPVAAAKVFGWKCDNESAAEIDQLTNDLLTDGVAQSAITAELAEFLGMDRSAAAEPSVLTNEQASAWIGVLKSWITSRGTNE